MAKIISIFFLVSLWGLLYHTNVRTNIKSHGEKSPINLTFSSKLQKCNKTSRNLQFCAESWKLIIIKSCLFPRMAYTVFFCLAPFHVHVYVSVFFPTGFAVFSPSLRVQKLRFISSYGIVPYIVNNAELQNTHRDSWSLSPPLYLEVRCTNLGVVLKHSEHNVINCTLVY